MGQTLGVSTIGFGVEHIGYRPMLATAGVALAALAFWFRRRLASLEPQLSPVPVDRQPTDVRDLS